MIQHLSFEDFLGGLSAGEIGSTIQRRIERLTGNGEAELAELYTVYWPKDSIRVIEGSTFSVARAVLSILRDPRTLWMGEPTAPIAAVLAIPRRDLVTSSTTWATLDQVRGDAVYKQDRTLPHDIRVDIDAAHQRQGVQGVTYRLDLSTLPNL